MLSGAVTNRYTLGFYEVAKAHGVVDAVDQSLQALSEALHAHPELKSFLEHPLIANDAKVKAIENIFGTNLEPIVLRFLGVLFSRGRSAFVNDIAARFHALAETAKGVVTVHVESAAPMNEEQLENLTSALSTALQKKPNAVVELNPELIAGYRARIGNRVLDASIRGALSQFSDKLLAGGAMKEGTL